MGSSAQIYPYRAWWGLAACAALMGVIMLLAPFTPFELQPRAHSFDYPWKLPDPTAWTRAIAWTCYALHQVGIWYLIYRAQTLRPGYAKGLHTFNVQALALNGGFVLLHIAQTKWTYDALAQDVPELTALLSVALMLFVILIMENDRRGMFFGKRVPFPQAIGEYTRKYHGYYFSWAITYTFWYHPVEVTPGHLLGFFYMFLLLLQGSLFMTRYHVNRWWTLSLEMMMVLHGTTVAYFAVAGLEARWSHFLFGGLTVFLITQMHGVPFKRWQKAAIVAAILMGAAFYYTSHIEELARIPRILLVRYGATFILAGLIWLIIRPFVKRRVSA
ncbi:MAG: hypothetical protein HKN56_02755 [Gammaproteobacteria bacterium]|nr:hypothetical protein [Gammaproteobacteria bacterium]